MDGRPKLYMLSEQFAGEGRDVLVLGQHVKSLSDVELLQIVDIERGEYAKGAWVTTNMMIYCNHVRAELNQRNISRSNEDKD